MKNLGLIGLLSILIYTNAFTSEGWVRVPVKDIQKTDVEGIFEIISPEQFSKVKLDCVSFIHGLNFYDKDTNGEWNMSYSFPLSEPECQGIYKFINESLEKERPACLELNIIGESYQLSRKDESCRLGS
jgi:hypothetical protein